MKILELGKFYPPVRGGIETLLKSFCEGFARKGAEVDCVVANETGETRSEMVNGVRVQRIGSFGKVFSTSLSPGYLKAALESGAKLWHAQLPNPLADLAILRAPKEARIIITYHSDIVRQAGLMSIYRPILEKCLDRADKIVVATPRHIEFSTLLQPRREKCAVIPFGIDAKRLEIATAAPNAPKLLTVGRLVGYKGHRWLIDAMKDVDATLGIVGTGPLEGELRRQAAAAGLKNVQFLGNIPDENLPALYQGCEIFVLPSISKNEAFGIVQLEAMACGKPVISCNLESGVPWVNQLGVTGLIVPPCDAHALFKAIWQLLNDPALARKMGAAGRARVAAEFTEEKMIDSYYQLFQEVAAA